MADAVEAGRLVVGQRAGRGSPLVSVVVPAYNCASHIGETLESVYGQTYRHWEVIVVDDGSTDETRTALVPHMGKIRYVRQGNRGTAAARNAGVRQARGELIAFLDDDDIWLPDKLELQVQVMEGSPECGLVFTDGKTFTADGIRQESVISTRLDGWIDAHRVERAQVAKGWLGRHLLFWSDIVSASSVMVRRECFDQAGGFDEGIAIADDYDLWLKIALAHPVALVQHCLYMWRWHDESQSGPVAGRQHRWMEASLVVLEKHLALAPLEIRGALRAHMARLYWSCARHYFDLDQFRESRRMLVGCLRHNGMFLRARLLLVASRLDGSTIRAMRRVKRGGRTWWRRVAGRRRG